MEYVIEILKNWHFRQAGDDNWLDAVVPGTVHTDLKRHKLVSDPFYRMNENHVQWVEEKDWEYKTLFIVDNEALEQDVVEMFFEGLDTYADVYLNGKMILQADNMFIGWRVNCKPYLKAGDNEMRIYFHSPVKRGLEKLKAFGHHLPMPNEQSPVDNRTCVFTRKAAFHYGWDWGPRLVASGIWRPVRISAWSGAKIRDVYLVTQSIENNRAKIEVQMEIDVVRAGEYSVAIGIDGKESFQQQGGYFQSGLNSLGFDFHIDNPKLWWTNGLGEACLYDFEFQLLRDGQCLSSHRLRFGIRTLRHVQEADEAGHSFYFELNGVPVFMKGANIIPSKTITPEVTEADYRKMIGSAVDANMNMLRVWGGAIYEEDRFYELCSENGILVWQDFMFACALQPAIEEHLDNIRKEAEYNVKRLRNHACLALWCGNNEVLIGWYKWGWQEMFEPELQELIWKTYRQIFHDILPSAVQKLDRKTAYWPSSPATIDSQLPDRKSGDEHDWTVWFGQKPIEAFWDNVPRFVSEWGMQSMPDMATIRAFAEAGDLSLRSEVMRHRQRCRMDWLQPGFDGNDMIRWYIEQYFEPTDNFERLVYLSQLLQAMAYKTAIEAHRTAMPQCMGSLYWQLNDCWPTVSWSSVDFYFRWKAAHYAVKRAFAPIILTATNDGGKVDVFVVSDQLKPHYATLQIELMDFSGGIVFLEKREIVIRSFSAKLVFDKDFSDYLKDEHETNRLLNLSLYVENELIADNNLFFVKPKYLKLAAPDIRCKLNRIDNGYLLKLKSDNLVKGLKIILPDTDAQYSDNFFDLLPGRDVKVSIKSQLSGLGNNDVSFQFL
jgi:beta-mannosidase